MHQPVPFLQSKPIKVGYLEILVLMKYFSKSCLNFCLKFMGIMGILFFLNFSCKIMHARKKSIFNWLFLINHIKNTSPTPYQVILWWYKLEVFAFASKQQKGNPSTFLTAVAGCLILVTSSHHNAWTLSDGTNTDV